MSYESAVGLYLKEIVDLKAQLERERAKSVVADTLVGVNEQLTAANARAEDMRVQLSQQTDEFTAARAEIAELSKDPMLVYCRKITLLRGTIAKLEAEVVTRLADAHQYSKERDRWRELCGRMAEGLEKFKRAALAEKAGREMPRNTPHENDGEFQHVLPLLEEFESMK